MCHGLKDPGTNLKPEDQNKFVDEVLAEVRRKP